MPSMMNRRCAPRPVLQSVLAWIRALQLYVTVSLNPVTTPDTGYGVAQVSRATVRAMLVAIVCGVLLSVLLWVYSPWLMTCEYRCLRPSCTSLAI